MPPVLDRSPAPRWLLALTLAVSGLLHVGAGFVVSTVFSAPDLDIEFQVPVDVELGLTHEAALVPAGPSEPAPPPAAAPQAEPGEKPGPKPPDDASDAGTPEDAGAPEKPAPKKPRPKPEPEPDASDAGVAAPGDQPVGARLPPGAQIVVRVDMGRIRSSPVAEDVRALLAAVPDWKALLEGSGIDPVSQLDRLLIATPNLQRTKIVVAGRYLGPRHTVLDAVDRLAAAQGVPAAWRTQSGVRIAPWANPDVTPRVIALVGPAHFTISREEDLPRVLAIAAARAGKQAGRGAPAPPPAEALLSMEPNEGISVEVEGVEQFVRRATRGIPSRLRLSAIEVPGPLVELHGRLAFADAQRASEALQFWDGVRNRYARNPLVLLLGLAEPLQEAKIEQRDAELHIQATLSVAQTRLVLGYLRELLTPAAPPAPAPSIAPPTAPPTPAPSAAPPAPPPAEPALPAPPVP